MSTAQNIERFRDESEDLNRANDGVPHNSDTLVALANRRV